MSAEVGVNATRVIVLDRDAILVKLGRLRAGLVAWIEDPAPKMPGLRFEVDYLARSDDLRWARIQVAMRSEVGPHSILALWEIDARRIATIEQRSTEDVGAAIVARELDNMHSLLVEKARAFTPANWPRRFASIVASTPAGERRS